MRPQGIALHAPIDHFLASGAVRTFVGRPPRGPIAYAGPGQPPLPIYLNRNGGTYTRGQDDSRFNTSIVPRGRSTISPYAGSQAEWDQIVACLVDMFSRFNAVIVETEPAGGEYIESVIGGTPQQVGLGQGVGGVAPIDPYQCEIIPNAIVFTFAEVVGNDPQTSCEIAAQEIAHALSLDHEYHCPDPMTYLGGCGDKVFRDYDAQCGEYSQRACNCNRPSQNSVQVLLEKLGPSTGMPPPPPPNDPIPPTVSITSPADGANLPENSTIQVVVDATDNLQIAATELVWDFSNATWPCPYSGNGGAVTCARSGNVSTWSIRVGQGDRTFRARARDTAGNVSETPSRTIHLGTGTPPPPNDTTPPTAEIISPADGAMLPGNSTVQVVATADDAGGLAAVELRWQASSFPCPFTGQSVSCTQSGNQYTWNVQVSVGARTFSVRAVDLANNVTNTPARTIELTSDPGPTPPPNDTTAEENDNAGQAFPTRCGSAIDLLVTSTDEDWFAYDAPKDTIVEVQVAAPQGTVIGLELYTQDGATKLAESADILAAGGALRATSQGPALLARVTTPAASAGYRLTALCMAAPTEPPPTMPPPTMPPTTDPPKAGDNNPTGPAQLTTRGRVGGSGCSAVEPELGVLLLAGLALLSLGRKRAR